MTLGQRFLDRADGGRKLAHHLAHLREERPVILGLARGGVVIAAEVARELEAELDVLVARKVGAPSQPEYAIGAVAPAGTRVINEEAVASVGVSEEELERLVEREVAEVERRLAAYRGDRPPLHVAGRCAVVVDDGLATGLTAVAAARYVRTLNPARLVVAAPVCGSRACQVLSDEADEVLCAYTPDTFFAVGQFYEDFDQTEDEEVLALLSGRSVAL